MLLPLMSAQGQIYVLSQEQQQTCSPMCSRCATLPIAWEMFQENEQS